MKTNLFIKKQIPSFLFLSLSLLLFALVFALFDYDWQAYRIASILIFIFYFIYLVYKGIHYRNEQELKQQIETLEETLKDEINNNRLLREEIEEYFLLWVHQIKTPITASYLLLNEEEKSHTPQLKQEMLKIENYTNMALNYLKVQNPATDMNFSRITIDELVSPLLKKYRIQFIQSKVTLNYSKESAKVLTEPNLTSLMIEQILNNALKYTHDTIWIEFDDGTNQLIIRDNGPGIKVEDQQKIFDKGYAGMNGQLSTKSSGIGLYLVKLIAKRLEQPISVTSTVHQGAEFIIQFAKD